MKNDSITMEMYHDIKKTLTPIQMLAAATPFVICASIGLGLSVITGMKFELQNKKENDIYE